MPAVFRVIEPRVEKTFAWGDVSPRALVIVGAGKVVERITVFIEEAFDGTAPSIQIGDAGQPGRLLTTDDNDPATVGSYTVFPGHSYGVDTAINLTIDPGAGGSHGSGLVVIELED